MNKLKSLLRRLSGAVEPKETKMLASGEAAPDFEATAHDGSKVKLSDLRGKKVILWFYPKADTPG